MPIAARSPVTSGPAASPSTPSTPLAGGRQPLPGPRLRSLLVPAAERALHPLAEARELAPGLHELIALRCAGGLQIPGRDELRVHGLDAVAAFVRARTGTCGEPLEFGRAGPLPGVHAYILGGPGSRDTAVAALELPRLGAALGPAGLVFAIPARSTALFVAPGARGLCRTLAQIGRFRQFWCSDGDAAPLRIRESLRFLATWTANAHARLPGPVSPALYWQRPGRPLAVLTTDARELDLPDLLHDL
jgi:hypothetical protein